MIAQLLNREFLLDAAEVTRLDLLRAMGDAERRSSDAGPLAELPVEHIDEVVVELRRIAATEPAEGLQPGAGGPSRAVPKDDFAYMPREPLLAILQTVIEEVAEEQRPDAIEAGAPDDERRSGGGDPVVSDRRFTGIDLPRSADGRRAWGRFEIAKPRIFSDPRWVWSGVVIAWHRYKEKAAFPGLPPSAIDIADDARIVLVGDWGSGIERAGNIAARIREELVAGATDGRQQHVIHLGDVYYTGSEKEYERNFLAGWPVTAGQAIGSYTLAGNHDMYQGGHAYYGRCLGDTRFSRQDGRSIFALRSSAWQFLALDSAYADKSLHGGQVEWILGQLASHRHHRTALLSHHQLFSAFEDGAEPMGEQIQPVLDSKRVDAWFWGHEHRCLTYRRHRDVGFSSCLGHGGIPEYLVTMEPEELRAPLAYDYRKQHGDGWAPWNTFGFAVLDLDGRAMRVRYIDEDGTPHHEERLAE